MHNYRTVDKRKESIVPLHLYLSLVTLSPHTLVITFLLQNWKPCLTEIFSLPPQFRSNRLVFLYRLCTCTRFFNGTKKKRGDLVGLICVCTVTAEVVGHVAVLHAAILDERLF